MTITKQANGNLEMSLAEDTPRFKHDFASKRLVTNETESIFIRKWLSPFGFKEIKPEDCGALTAAPLITDGKDVWGFMNYQVISFLEKLNAGETIIWQKG
jgi:hypothetical protein